MTTCPCGSNKILVDCCGLYLHDNKISSSAETLMRSRYTAYTLLNENYLLKTWHPSARPVNLNLAATPTKWIGLEVKRCAQIDDKHATVEFVARYKINGRAYKMHEISNFVYEDGCWLYLDGNTT